MQEQDGQPFLGHIILYDDDAIEMAQIKEHLLKVFANSQVVMQIDLCSSDKELRAHLARHPDVVITDLSLQGNDDTTGLDVIANLKPRYPHVVFGVMSNNLNLLQWKSQISVFPELLLPKRQLLLMGDEYSKQFLDDLLRLVRQNRGIKILMDSKTEAKIKNNLKMERMDRQTIECLIRQVFVLPNKRLSGGGASKNGAGSRSSDMIIDTVEVRAFSDSLRRTGWEEVTRVGRSGSAVCLAVPKLNGQPQGVSVVLKFSTLSSYQREIGNFNRYVKWTLPSALRVDVLGTGHVAGYGVICYSVAFNDSTRPQEFNRYLTEEHQEPVLKVVHRIFDLSNRIWYKNPSVLDGNTNLVAVLLERYFPREEDRSERIDKVIKQICRSQVFRTWSTSKSSATEDGFLKQFNRLLQYRTGPFEQCVCHGDLHGGNIIMSASGEEMVFIDFEDTGLLHVFTDFVFLENAVRKDGKYDWERDLHVAIERETACIRAMLNDQKQGSRGAGGLPLIVEIRSMAIANFPMEKKLNYFLHALILSILMLTMKSLRDDQTTRLIVFCVACIDVLSRNGYDRLNEGA